WHTDWINEPDSDDLTRFGTVVRAERFSGEGSNVRNYGIVGEKDVRTRGPCVVADPFSAGTRQLSVVPREKGCRPGVEPI
ncbi:MAG: hypothetical protein ACREA0_20315, partial [bacterium]